MEQQCLATLQTFLTDGGTGAIEKPLLERFYKHCARQPLVVQRRLANCSLRTLLYHYCFLRPGVQAALAEFVAVHWQFFSAEIVLPDMTDNPPQAVPDPVLSKHEPSPIANQCAPQGTRDDWFDRILDGVRILLFR